MLGCLFEYFFFVQNVAGDFGIFYLLPVHDFDSVLLFDDHVVAGVNLTKIT